MPFDIRGLRYPTLMLVAACSLWAASGGAAVTVMTQNMDAGTDLKFVLAYINSSTPTTGIDLTYQEVANNNFAARAEILAREIKTAAPDLVSLQEVTTWSKGPSADVQVPFVDQLSLLQDALSAAGAEYSVVKQQFLTAMALPMSDNTFLGFVDSNVVLARKGVATSHATAGQFADILRVPTNLGLLVAPDGWISVDVTVGSETFTFVDTHLVSPIAGFPQIEQLQAAQATELATTFAGSTHIVIAGDFNSNAAHTPPERTPSVAIMTGSGFIDAWPVVNHGNPGYTWPAYLEDPPAPHPNGPYERIDFVFERGFSVRSVERVGWNGPHASDHAGVVAVLKF